MHETIKTFAARFIRHGLTAGGAILVGKGIIDEDGALALVGVAEVIAGVIAFGVGLLWSYLSDKFITRK